MSEEPPPEIRAITRVLGSALFKSSTICLAPSTPASFGVGWFAAKSSMLPEIGSRACS